MKMRIMLVLFGLLLFGLLAISAHAQTLTVTGNYCGSTFGNHNGTFAFRVGSTERDFEVSFSNTRMIRFEPGAIRVGDEFVIKYRGNSAKTITGTGKRRRVTPCNMD